MTVDDDDEEDDEEEDENEVSQWSIAVYPIGASYFLYQRCMPSVCCKIWTARSSRRATTRQCTD